MDKHQLLSSTVQRLDEMSAAPDANSVQSVRSSSASKRRRSSEDDLEAQQSVSTAIMGLAKEQEKDQKSRNEALAMEHQEKVRDRLNKLRDTLRDYRRYRAEARCRQETDMVHFYNEEIESLEEDIQGNELQLMTQRAPDSQGNQETQQSNDTTMPSP